MDPNAALTELRALMTQIRIGARVSQTQVERIAELWDALDDWLADGGFLPTEWQAFRWIGAHV